jgi:hypothetical protein
MENKTELTDKQISEMLTHKLITSVMTAQILNNQLHDLTVAGLFKQRDKMIITNAKNVLLSIESKHYDRFWDEKQKETSEIYQTYELFLNLMSVVPIYDVENILYLYDLYKNHREELDELINKINKDECLPDQN